MEGLLSFVPSLLDPVVMNGGVYVPPLAFTEGTRRPLGTLASDILRLSIFVCSDAHYLSNRSSRPMKPAWIWLGDSSLGGNTVSMMTSDWRDVFKTISCTPLISFLLSKASS